MRSTFQTSSRLPETIGEPASRYSRVVAHHRLAQTDVCATCQFISDVHEFSPIIGMRVRPSRVPAKGLPPLPQRRFQSHGCFQTSNWGSCANSSHQADSPPSALMDRMLRIGQPIHLARPLGALCAMAHLSHETGDVKTSERRESYAYRQPPGNRGHHEILPRDHVAVGRRCGFAAGRVRLATRSPDEQARSQHGSVAGCRSSVRKRRQSDECRSHLSPCAEVSPNECRGTRVSGPRATGQIASRLRRSAVTCLERSVRAEKPAGSRATRQSPAVAA